MAALLDDPPASPSFDELAAQYGGVDVPPAKPPSETTRLAPAEEQRFQQWTHDNGITNVDHPDAHYDMRGFWHATGGAPHPPGAEQHFPDTFKQHGHPTFSVESKYSRGPT